jgi:phage terminase large subunit-like protein
MCGTPPTPLSAGTVFTKFRDKALEGGAPNVGWVDWSVEDVSDPKEKDLWYLTNPSLGTIFTERSVEDELGTDEIDFNIQRLGLWIKYNQKSAISKNDWEALKIEVMPKLKGKLFVGIKFGRNGDNVAMSIAAKTTDGKVFVESLDCQSVRNGRAWMVAFLTRADVEQIVIDGASGQNLLVNDLKDARVKVRPILPTVKEVINANASFEQGVFSGTICHAGQPSLHQVATNCEKRAIGSSGGFGYKSQFDDFDISLLDSAILAHWACVEAKPKKVQRITY